MDFSGDMAGSPGNINPNRIFHFCYSYNKEKSVSSPSCPKFLLVCAVN